MISLVLNRRFAAAGFEQMAIMRLERPSCAACLFNMDTVTQYHKFAEVCERLAIQTSDEQHKKILWEMASTWRELAEKIEGENDR